MTQKAAAVVPGATVGIVAPAGPVDPKRLANGIRRFESWGYRVRVGEAVLATRGYLAGDDAARAADFNRIWADPAVSAVICARGGYGTMRLLERLDWDLIRSTPKFFCGFSDITALHVAMERCAGLITFHGPMAAAFGEAEGYNGEWLQRAMEAVMPLGTVAWPEGVQADVSDRPTPLTIVPGIAEGQLGGGNLSLLCSLMGTPWEPDFAGRIVLLEDVDEAPYQIDRMLQHLLLGGKLQRASGILFGDSPSCSAGRDASASLSLHEVLQDLLAPLGIPVLYGFPCGHTAYRATLPLGVHARLDADAASLTILEAALV